MCGINGFTFRDDRLIARMNELTRHRGPDQTAKWVSDFVSLGHNRLAIIDLSERGNQPMWDANREIVVVFNGEIYNFKELRKDLEKKYHFHSASDTEVIVYAYKEYGTECFAKLNGIFALAIWDTRTNTLILARDRIGVNPLYYYHDGSKLVFSSEIKAILAHEFIPRRVDPTAFNLYFKLLYVPTPHTMFEGVKKLPPATYAVFKAGTLTHKKYWEVTDFSDLASYKEAREQISKLFPSVVRDQIISDRPVGVFLSGGIDSTAVLGAVHTVQPDKIKTFSVGFKDSTDPEKFNADFLLARQTAAYYHTNHHELMISATDVKDRLEQMAWHLDEPNSNPTAGAMFLLSELAKKEVAVVLGGDGGDELFGGYPRYYYSRIISFFQSLPRPLQRPAIRALNFFGRSRDGSKLSLGRSADRLIAFLGQPESTVESVISKEIFNSKASLTHLIETFFKNSLPTTDFEKYFMNVDRQSWLVDESLLRTNKMSMAFGLEPRVPILDFRLVELASRIPTSWKFDWWRTSGSNFQGKKIWREAINNYLPNHIKYQKKRGWFTPMAKWVRQEPLRGFVKEILFSQELPAEFFNAASIQKICNDHLESRVYNLNIIWATVMWVLWYNKFIKKTTQIL